MNGTVALEGIGRYFEFCIESVYKFIIRRLSKDADGFVEQGGEGAGRADAGRIQEAKRSKKFLENFDKNFNFCADGDYNAESFPQFRCEIGYAAREDHPVRRQF